MLSSDVYEQFEIHEALRLSIAQLERRVDELERRLAVLEAIYERKAK